MCTHEEAEVWPEGCSCPRLFQRPYWRAFQSSAACQAETRPVGEDREFWLLASASNTAKSRWTLPVLQDLIQGSHIICPLLQVPHRAARCNCKHLSVAAQDLLQRYLGETSWLVPHEVRVQELNPPLIEAGYSVFFCSTRCSAQGPVAYTQKSFSKT